MLNKLDLNQTLSLSQQLFASSKAADKLLSDTNALESSANRVKSAVSVAYWISFIQTRKSKVPSMDPCGTPVDTGRTVDRVLLTDVDWCLSNKYEVNHLCTIPRIP